MGTLLGIPLDERQTVQVAAGIVDDEGQQLIRQFLADQLGADHVPTSFDWNWMSPKGGSLSKRLASLYYKTGKVKFLPDVMTAIGNLARQYSSERDTYVFEITRDLGWSSGDFGDAGSCYWNSRSDCLRLLRSHATAYALRFYDPENGRGMARCWLVTMDLENPLLALFNGYGLSLLTMTRVLADTLGLSYKRVNMWDIVETSDYLYINDNRGTVIRSQEKLLNLSGVDLNLGRITVCAYCQSRIEENADDTYRRIGRELWCLNCVREHWHECEHCHQLERPNRMRAILFYPEPATERQLCTRCQVNQATTCGECRTMFDNQHATLFRHVAYCPRCAAVRLAECSLCGNQRLVTATSGLCHHCEAYFFTCTGCHQLRRMTNQTTFINNEQVCSACTDQLLETCANCGEQRWPWEMNAQDQCRACAAEPEIIEVPF